MLASRHKSWPAFIEYAHSHSAENEHAKETHNERQGHHGAAMLLILSTLARRHLYVALFAMNMWLGLENAREGLYERFGWVRWFRSVTGRSLAVIVNMRLKLYVVVVLCDCSVLGAD
jgi:hypothetical protein